MNTQSSLSKICWITGIFIALLAVGISSGYGVYLLANHFSKKQLLYQFENLKKLDAALQRFATENYTISACQILKYAQKCKSPELLSSCRKYLLLHAILNKNQKMYLLAKNNIDPQIWAVVSRKCTACRNGDPICDICKNTKICQRCKGTGYRSQPILVLGKSGYSSQVRKPCPKHCTFCPKGKCLICKGVGKVFQPQKVLLQKNEEYRAHCKNLSKQLHKELQQKINELHKNK